MRAAKRKAGFGGDRSGYENHLITGGNKRLYVFDFKANKNFGQQLIRAGR